MNMNLQSRLNEAKNFLHQNTVFKPRLALVLGSGLGPVVERFEVIEQFPYSDIPHFHSTTVAGHEGQLIFARLKNTDVVIMQGRIHAYEGHDHDSVVFPVRLMRTLGAEITILTNAAGGVNKDYKPGQLVLIKDHLNLTGTNPLLGANHEFLGPRFPDQSEMYPRRLRQVMKEAALKVNQSLSEGVYAGVLGPSYETPAEIRMLRNMGADLVGMSTVSEAIAAHHAGSELIGLSCVTNMAAGILDVKLNHDDIKTEALKAMKNFGDILEHSIPNL
jgi:purine-nucleoside phosphorylase